MTHLDKLKVWGKQIKCAPSKHAVVQMPKEGQPDAGLTKDYTNSPLHRFKKPNSKNHHNIFPPSATLHLSNIPWVPKNFFQSAYTSWYICGWWFVYLLMWEAVINVMIWLL